MNSELTWFGRLSRAWDRRNKVAFVGLVIYNLRMLLTGRYWEHSHLFDDAFDREFYVETRGTEEAEYLTADEAAKVHGRRYEAATVEQMTILMEKLRDLDLSRFTFVDLGSGKGRALFIAANFPFRRIIGVEYGRELHDKAVRNIASYRNPAQRCFDIESNCADASTFEFPQAPTICFMYNPFDDVLVGRVVGNLSAEFATSPREFFLVYLQANHPAVIDRVPGWERLHEGLIPPRTPFVIWRWQETTS